MGVQELERLISLWCSAYPGMPLARPFALCTYRRLHIECILVKQHLTFFKIFCLVSPNAGSSWLAFQSRLNMTEWTPSLWSQPYGPALQDISIRLKVQDCAARKEAL